MQATSATAEAIGHTVPASTVPFVTQGLRRPYRQVSHAPFCIRQPVNPLDRTTRLTAEARSGVDSRNTDTEALGVATRTRMT